MELLQVIGYASTALDFITIPQDKFITLSSLIDYSPLPNLSEKELWDNLMQRNRRAREAELCVVEYERRRLNTEGAPHLASLVKRISEFNVNDVYGLRVGKHYDAYSPKLSRSGPAKALMQTLDALLPSR